MGMYDSIYMNVKCPYCNIEEEQECQTKELDCTLSQFKVGDFVGWDIPNKIEACLICRSQKCKHHQKDIRYNGGGRFFEILIEIRNGKITNNYEYYIDNIF